MGGGRASARVWLSDGGEDGGQSVFKFNGRMENRQKEGRDILELLGVRSEDELGAIHACDG